MAKPRWSELAAEFGLDWPAGGVAPDTEALDPRSTREVEPPVQDRIDALEEAFDRLQGSPDQDDDRPDVLSGRDEPLHEELEEPVAVAFADVDVAVGRPPRAEAESLDHRVEPAPVFEPREPAGGLLLSDEAQAAEIQAPSWSGGDDRFAELGSNVAQAMRVAYGAVAEMKRLDQRLAALLEVHESLRKTLVEASEELHRSLTTLTFGEDWP